MIGRTQTLNSGSKNPSTQLSPSRGRKKGRVLGGSDTRTETTRGRMRLRVHHELSLPARTVKLYTCTPNQGLRMLRLLQSYLKL